MSDFERPPTTLLGIPERRNHDDVRFRVLLILTSIVLLVAMVAFMIGKYAGSHVSLIAYLANNFLDIVEFIILLIVVIGMQIIRSEFNGRTARFERIDKELTELREEMRGHGGTGETHR